MEDDGNFLSNFDAFDVSNLVTDQFDQPSMDQQQLILEPQLVQQVVTQPQFIQATPVEQHQQVYQQQPVVQHVVQPQHQVVHLQQQPVQQQQVVLSGTMMNLNGQQFVIPSTTQVETVTSTTHQQPQTIIVTSVPTASNTITTTSAPKRRTTILVKAQYLPQQREEPSPTKARGRRAAVTTVRGGAGGQKKKKDPGAPTPAHSAYKFFYKETGQNVKNHNPGVKFGDVSRIVAGMWESMSDEEKEKYRQMAADDKVRYAKELEEYNRKREEPEAEPQENSVVFTSTSTTLSVVNTTTNGQTDPADVTENNCIRDGCLKMALLNPEWEGEYCSNDCVVQHCKNVFSTFTANAIATAAEQAAA